MQMKMGLRQKETRLRKRRGGRTCPSSRVSWAAASKVATTQQLARPRRSGGRHRRARVCVWLSTCRLTRTKRVPAEMFQLCTTTPPERSTRRWRAGAQTGKGTDTNAAPLTQAGLFICESPVNHNNYYAAGGV